jgi:uncharacterized protein YjgD (DUF1641 family)
MSEEKKYPPLHIRLANRTNTQWIMEGTENTPNPVYMDYPANYVVIPHSKVKYEDPNNPGKQHPEKKGFRQIRHIFGCEHIDPEVQKAHGFTPDNMMDKIFITNGVLQVHREGSAIGTYDYLRAYQGNANNPLRPDEAEIEFEEVHEDQIALQKVVDFEVVMEAMGLLNTIRSKQADDTYQYNEQLLSDMASLFNLDVNDDQNVLFMQLVGIAQREPEKIVNTAINPLKSMIVDIKKADRLGAIQFDQERIFYPGEHKVVLLSFKTKTAKENMIKKLAEHLTMPGNLQQLNNFRVILDAKEKEALEPVR